MSRQQWLIFVACAGGVAVDGLIIALTGGLPSQLAHIYYVPVVAAALLLPLRFSLAVALLAGAAVSPLPDLFHRPLGFDVYYDDPAPWNLSPQGWIVRPLAFLAISLLAHRLMEEYAGRMTAQTAGAVHRGELTVLGRIDKMILAGAGEDEALEAVARLAREATRADHAGIVLPAEQPGRLRLIQATEADVSDLVEQGIPAGEGVGGWALLHGKPAVSPDVLSDPRYETLRQVALRLGYVSAAAAPIILDRAVLAAVSVCYNTRRDFDDDVLATLLRVADQASIAVANARQREALRRLSFETAIGLAEAIEGRDPYTGDHCSRLSGYAAMTAKTFGITNGEIELIRLGAALHDVGKIVVPDQILKKPDKLTPAEFAIIKQHCYHGGQICKRVSFLSAAFPIVYHHHERWDGRGYPDGLKGERIPFGARIVGVVDAFDAMVSDRPYRKAMPEEEARAILRDGAGSQWDAAVVEKFLSLQWDSQAGHGLTAAA